VAKRTYDQYCPAARALDVIGERWTVLLVRELLLGPKRYTDLLEGLPGIGPNVLAERLRHLQEAGIVERSTMPPPAASTVYQLTNLGEALRPVVQELGRWGLNVMGVPKRGDRFRLSWLMRSMEATFRPEAARGLHETYEFRIDGEVLHVRVDDGQMEVREGPAPDPICRVTTDLGTFIAVATRTMPSEVAIESGKSVLEGDPEANKRSIEILGPHFGGLGSPGGILGAIEARLRPEASRGVRESYEFRMGEHAFHVRVDDGEAEVVQGWAEDPELVLTSDLGTFVAIGIGQIHISEAMAEGRVRIKGDPGAIERAWKVLDVEGDAEPVPA
jgi:DNA-binding HxlR family transcriptional regulator